MSDYTPKKGDRVRVVLEGVVSEEIDDFGIKIDNEQGRWLSELYTDREGVKVEKYVPPVEQFQAGDLVRDRGTGDVLALGPDGYTYVSKRRRGAHYSYDAVTPLSEFTSERYERVEV